MPASARPLRRLAAALAGAALAFAAAAQEGPAPAQPAGPAESPPAADAPDLPVAPVLTLDQDRLFRDSAWGRAAVARAEAEGAALTAENRRIEEALEKEERDLTKRRATMEAADFAALAAEFDQRVEEIRTAQDTKARAIARRLDEDRQHFFEAATPVLGALLAETGASAILADSAVILSLTALDITPRAIERMDAALPAPAPPEDAAPAPEPAPAPELVPPSSP